MCIAVHIWSVTCPILTTASLHGSVNSFIRCLSILQWTLIPIICSRLLPHWYIYILYWSYHCSDLRIMISVDQMYCLHLHEQWFINDVTDRCYIDIYILTFIVVMICGWCHSKFWSTLRSQRYILSSPWSCYFEQFFHLTAFWNIFRILLP